MVKKKSHIFLVLAAFLCGLIININLSNNDNVLCTVCFTPGQECTQRIVDKINSAEHEILVQSYSFTSQPIADALIRAHKRNVKVVILLDHSQEGKMMALKFMDAGIPLYIDHPPGIAHNKVMIIDEKIVLTGSFNFTQAAQHRNVENSVCITSPKMALTYKEQWVRRKALCAKHSDILSVEQHHIPKQKRPLNLNF